MEILFAYGIILIVGYFFGLIAERLNLPRVTAYLLSGVLFSEELLGSLLDLHFNSWSEILINICLGIIAFVVGCKLQVNNIMKSRGVIFWGTLFESLTPVLLVFFVFFALGQFISVPLEYCIVMASVAATTAPAATIAIIEQYKAKGEMTDAVLGIVALDDAFGIIIFSILTSLFLGNSGNNLSGPFLHIGISIAVGSILGIMLSKFAKLSETNDYLFPLLIGLIFVTEGLSDKWNFSFLLACIALGFVSNNTFPKSTKFSLLLPIEHIEEFVFITFFTFAGTHFSLIYFKQAMPMILIYFSVRIVGKYVGALIGTKIGSPVNKKIPSWIGLALLPQAGIAIGLIFKITHDPNLQEIRDLLINTVLGSTILYEVLGPLLAKQAFLKVNEIDR
jgi:Kef-type K+ transport system membrane component KefB